MRSGRSPCLTHRASTACYSTPQSVLGENCNSRRLFPSIADGCEDDAQNPKDSHRIFQGDGSMMFHASIRSHTCPKSHSLSLTNYSVYCSATLAILLPTGCTCLDLAATNPLTSKRACNGLPTARQHEYASASWTPVLQPAECAASLHFSLPAPSSKSINIG